MIDTIETKHIKICYTLLLLFYNSVKNNTLVVLKKNKMLALRPTCENCNKALPPQSTAAMICTYECTFCCDCVSNVLYNVCPNCGGNFVPRPIRLKEELQQNPASIAIVYKPIDALVFQKRLEKNKDVPPEKR